MSFKFKVLNFKFRFPGFRFKAQEVKIFYFLLFTFYFLLCSCGLSMPNLEPPECTEARDRVREFYSYHSGNDMKPSNEYLEQHRKFLTEDLIRQLKEQTGTAKDYFTQTDDYPKAFRVGACEAVSPEKTIFEVLLFWKDDVRSQQREVKVEMIRQNDIWLINQVNL